MRLASKRMDFRPFQDKDFQHLKRLHQDSEVMEFLTGGIPQEEMQVWEFLQHVQSLDGRYEGKLGYVAAIRKSDEAFLGWFHFRPDRQNPQDLSRIELGYRLHKDFWGMGLATEGSLALIEYGSTVGHIQEIFAETLSRNSGSRKVMAKLKMKLQKEFPHERFPEVNEFVVRYALQLAVPKFNP